MRKTVLILIVALTFCSCSTQKMANKQVVVQPPAISPPPTQVAKELSMRKKGVTKALSGDLLKDVIVLKSSFNPTLGEKVSISYSLSRPAQVTVNVYDPDHGLVISKKCEEFLPVGKHAFIWDGRDMNGNIVPDEAYFFTITAQDRSGLREIYDPTTFSGGVEHDITDAYIDPESHTITYTMPEMGRVMIRLGIQGGPLMNQLVDWKPRTKGVVNEYWDGKDRDKIVDIYNNPKFKMIISYFSLPENSVITFGNKSYDFRTYKKTMAMNRPTKPKRASSVLKVSHHYHLPRTVDYCPKIHLSFSNLKGYDRNGIPILYGKTMVKVDLAKEDKPIFQNQKFEICFFLDGEFYAEDEAGYTPFNWVWDISNVPAGEHIFTVNLSGFKDQIGVSSKRIRVVK